MMLSNNHTPTPSSFGNPQVPLHTNNNNNNSSNRSNGSETKRAANCGKLGESHEQPEDRAMQPEHSFAFTSSLTAAAAAATTATTLEGSNINSESSSRSGSRLPATTVGNAGSGKGQEQLPSLQDGGATPNDVFLSAKTPEPKEADAPWQAGRRGTDAVKDDNSNTNHVNPNHRHNHRHRHHKHHHRPPWVPGGKNDSNNKESGRGGGSGDEPPEMGFTSTENIPAISHYEFENAELHALMMQYQGRNWAFLFLLGLFNNFHYNMVISGANGLAGQYGMKQFVALISFCNVFFGIFARVMNAFVANRVSYNIRISLMACISLVGLFFVSMSGPFGHGSDTSSFVVLLVGVAFTGTAYSYGETVALSFVQRYPPKTVSAWGSGTGISGVFTCVLYIVLTSAAGLTPQKVFLINMPLCLVYWLIFQFGIMAPHKVVTVSYPDGSQPDRVVILHRGHEDKKMLKLQLQQEHLGAVISKGEYKMLMNFFGLGWKQIPPASHTPAANKTNRKSTATIAAGAGAAGHGERCKRCSEDETEFSEKNGDGLGHEADFLGQGCLHHQEASAGKTDCSFVSSSIASPTKLHDDPFALHRYQQQQQKHAAAGAAVDLDRMNSKYNEASSDDDGTNDGNLYYPLCRCLCGCCSRKAPLRRWWHNNGKNIGMMHNAMSWFYLNLASVYAAEYAAQFMAPFCFYCKPAWQDNFWLKNSYTISQFCYQLGVFLSRSSLLVFKIPWIGTLSILQLINMVCWIVQPRVLFIAARKSETRQIGLSFILFIWMLFVGLIGGASYVNVFFLVLCRSKEMQKKEQDDTIAAFLASRHNNPPQSVASPTSAAVTITSQAGSVAHFIAAPSNPAVTTTQKACCSREEREGAGGDEVPSAATHDEDGAGMVFTTGMAGGASSATMPAKELAVITINVGKKLEPVVEEGRVARSSSSSSSSSDVFSYSSTTTYSASTYSDYDPAEGSSAGPAPSVPMTKEETTVVGDICHSLERQWQERRELGMAMGSLYAMVGICVGTILDVILANTMLKGISNCPATD